MAEVRARRSVLYMPGANERALEKAKSLPADALILDLEDLVAPEAKIAAREKVCAAVKGGGYGRREIIIRPNALETAWGTADILAAAEAAPDAILLPKVAHPGDIISAAKILKSVHASGENAALGHDGNAAVDPLCARNLRHRRQSREPALVPRHGHQ